MDVHDLAAKGGEQKRRNGLSLEQQRKFEELRERRLQLKNAQDDVISGTKKKKKRRKRGKKSSDQRPGSSSPKEAAGSETQRPSIEEKTATETARFGSKQRHAFAVTAGAGTAGEGRGEELSTAHDASVFQSSLAMVPSMVSENTSGMIIPAKTPEVPQQEVATSTKKKRKKLHWGMEVKERWERKANM